MELDGRIAEAGLYGPTEWDRLRAKASAEAHQGGRRALEVRLWLDELKAMPQIALEAKKLDPEGLEALGPTSRPSLRPSSTTTRPTSRSSAITCFIIRYPPRS